MSFSLSVIKRKGRLSKQKANSFILRVCTDKYSQAPVDKRAWSAWNQNMLWQTGEGGWAVIAAKERRASNSICHPPNASQLSKQIVHQQVGKPQCRACNLRVTLHIRHNVWAAKTVRFFTHPALLLWNIQHSYTISIWISIVVCWQKENWKQQRVTTGMGNKGRALAGSKFHTTTFPGNEVTVFAAYLSSWDHSLRLKKKDHQRFGRDRRRPRK